MVRTERSLSAFAMDTSKGLKAHPKYLLSKYLYDDKGSQIFQRIMQMPEYYLTSCEQEILQEHRAEIYRDVNRASNGKLEIVELGAGDGLKTMLLLDYFGQHSPGLRFVPIDISVKAVGGLVAKVHRELPGIEVSGQVGDYFELVGHVSDGADRKRLYLFLGSNIGNYNHIESTGFLQQLQGVMNIGDLLLIGFDLKKDPAVILEAYNDPYGYTAAFNLNLLARINRELEGNFKLENYYHEETYDPQSGTARSYLFSKSRQEVEIADLQEVVVLDEGEGIYMEMSQKYDHEMIVQMAHKTGFRIVRNDYDHRQFFVNSLWIKA